MIAIGCARVSTHERNPDLQHDPFTAAGCVRVFTDPPPAPRPAGRSWPLSWIAPSEKITVARKIHDACTYTVAQIVRTIGISRGTVYQHLDQNVAAR